MHLHLKIFSILFNFFLLCLLKASSLEISTSFLTLLIQEKQRESLRVSILVELWILQTPAKFSSTGTVVALRTRLTLDALLLLTPPMMTDLLSQPSIRKYESLNSFKILDLFFLCTKIVLAHCKSKYNIFIFPQQINDECVRFITSNQKSLVFVDTFFHIFKMLLVHQSLGKSH